MVANGSEWSNGTEIARIWFVRGVKLVWGRGSVMLIVREGSTGIREFSSAYLSIFVEVDEIENGCDYGEWHDSGGHIHCLRNDHTVPKFSKNVQFWELRRVWQFPLTGDSQQSERHQNSSSIEKQELTAPVEMGESPSPDTARRML